jgi:hypothetical protein
MAYAPYNSNIVVRGYVINELNNRYDFIDADSNQHPFPGYPHQIYVGNNGDKRYCKITKTRIYVVVDEDSEGNPVEEKWLLKKRRDYL